MKTACLILAAGQGKRMRSRLPKVLHPVCGEPLISYPVALARELGMDPIVVVVPGQAETLRDFVEHRYGKTIRFVAQDPPLGTGHAVLCAARAFRRFHGKLAILYGDVPLLAREDMRALARAGRAAEVAFLTCRIEDPSWYGRVVRDGRGRVARIVEARDAADSERAIREINVGTYLVDAPFVFSALRSLRNTNAQGEYYLTDLVELARRRGMRVSGVERPRGDWLLGVNDRIELSVAEERMRRRILDRHMLRGVTVIDPHHTHIGPRVRLGADTVIHPGCVIHGEVVIGSGCEIGVGAVIRDARIESGARVHPYSILDGCVVGRRAAVGPHARLRPGAMLADDVHVGTFVEVKKSRLGRGSKANHLTYLGDAEIGERVNVGAGTITCNYDGDSKHPTLVGDDVFIGSDTQLVAPVKVGRGAYIGAGTTITTDVPAGALAISRVRQRNIQGYRRRRDGRSRARK